VVDDVLSLTFEVITMTRFYILHICTGGNNKFMSLNFALFLDKNNERDSVFSVRMTYFMESIRGDRAFSEIRKGGAR
jgi:hypothetical protein